MDHARLRLADVLTSLAVAIELGLGVPAETVQRTALVAVRLARAAGLDEGDVVAAYHLALLRYVGCTATSHHTSQVVDELALGELLVLTDEEAMPEFQRVVAATRPHVDAQEVAASFGGPAMGRHHRNHCEVAELIAIRLELGPRIVGGLTHAYERWDGLGTQQLAEGEGVSLPMRVVHVAWQVGQDSCSRGSADIAQRLQVRSGRALDPGLAALAAADVDQLVGDLGEGDLTQQVVDAEPGEPIWLSTREIDRALTCVADFADLKSPHMIGHSRRVASVARRAARAASMTGSDVDLVGRAALVHDVGRVGVQSRLLAKAGPLSRAEREQIRLHSYFTGRVFAESPVLAPVGALGAAHHERLDGSGYHRGLEASGLSGPARLLAAANHWCSLTEGRPHRPAMTDADAATALSTHAGDGEFDRRCVDAVLTSVGQRGPRTRRAAAIALTEREIDVLRLVARERTNPAIATTLGISPKTVERHVTHIYEKVGVSSRAGAAIHALENGLL